MSMLLPKVGNLCMENMAFPCPSISWHALLISFEALAAENYDLVICTGGHEAPDRVRQDAKVLSFVRQMAEADKVVAGLCHGPWIMISAGVMVGRRACAYVGMKDDMRNAGAIVIEAPVIVDGPIITCSYYAYVEPFMQRVLSEVQRRQSPLPQGSLHE
jgi:deglycase